MTRFLAIGVLVASIALAQRGGGGGGGNRGGGGGRGGRGGAPLASLKTEKPPTPTGLDRYVKDQTALVALGKILFWDAQTGSDGHTACATCHFHAGTDHRLQNQLSSTSTVNHTLTAKDFPFHQLTDPNDSRSPVLRDSRQVAGSMGVVQKTFVDVLPGVSVDASTLQSNEIHTRQVTARNSPSVINAVYNVRNFWDGRASNIFTGATPFGESDTALNAWVYREGKLQKEAVRIENASLASQAVGPALNPVEMSWDGRDWAKLGQKLLRLAPLAHQKIAISDSVLGSMANPSGNGLQSKWSYPQLIQSAFRPEYWKATMLNAGHTQMERNFGLFWGLAIQAYEATLVSDDSRVDQFLDGQTGALSDEEAQGLQLFRRRGGQCSTCHSGPEFSAAGFSSIARRNGNGAGARNTGFFRIGVTPIDADAGLGGQDGFGQPLSAQGRANGTFKTPGLRNVEYTGPYFHDGSQATLKQVVDFYARNGDFPQGGNLGPGIGRIRLSQTDRTAMVAFLKALTDDRVRYQKAPFDHPSLCVPNGHVESPTGGLAFDTAQGGKIARDKWALVPEVGRAGAKAPLQTFEELLLGVGNDGSRANTMTMSCVP